MTTPPPSNPAGSRSLFRNWLSLSGIVVALGSLFAFAFLITMDYLAGEESPYLGILTYLVSPSILFLGLALTGLGWLLQRRRLAHAVAGVSSARLILDFSRQRDRRFLAIFLLASLGFLLVTAVGSYQTYHVTKSVTFCGTACHATMEPQYVAYQHSPHARVECTACHIRPGARSFVEAKLGGLHQVYCTWAGKIQRPIQGGSRIQIGQQTCEQCHWPQRFVGNLDRTFMHYLDDETNTPYAVRLLLKVGGADPTHGPVGGIHWHMNVNNKVEFLATDPLRQTIPWVRLTDARGKVTEFRQKGFTNNPAPNLIRTMDCLDCHNRPAHNFRAPNDSVDLAMSLGKISTNLPAVKHASVLALTKPYSTRQEGIGQIAASLKARYPASPALDGTIAEVQDIFRRDFFPEMKTAYQTHPNNIGHKDWKGCFRCHDNEHVTADGQRTISSKDCNSCHVIMAEGRGAELEQLTSAGRKFKHPEEGWEALNCVDCHNGTIEEKK